MPHALVGRRVYIVGCAREGMALARLLGAEGARVTVGDARPAEALRREVDGLVGATTPGLPTYPGGPLYRGLPLRFALGGVPPAEALAAEIVFASPGVPRDLPALRAAREAGIPVSSLTDLFFARCRAPITGITGSSGKTTTTTLVGKMLGQGERPVYVGGNIGTPLVEHLATLPPGAHVVLELSSFQLEDLRVSPHVAVVTNLSPNHLDRHGTMEAYVEAKTHILRHQGPADCTVLNADDPHTPELLRLCRGRVLTFSLEGAGPVRRLSAGCGAYLEGGHLVLAPDGVARGLCQATEMGVPGRHNVANALAAALAALAATEPAELAHGALARTLRGFRGVPHRLELVGEVDGVRWYNDSIATTPERTLAALAVFGGDPVVLLAGGRDKHLPWGDLAARIVRDCRALILFGEAADLIEGHVLAAYGAAEEAGASHRLDCPAAIERCASLEEAVTRAAARARRGDIVLLSPGGTSYDMFKDFEERGTRFRQLVEGF